MAKSITAERAKDRARQQRRRDKMAETRKPETHAVDRALSEALAYVVVSCHAQGSSRGSVNVPFKQVLMVASKILAHRGRFDLKQSIMAVAARTKARDSMAWTLPAPRRPEA